MLNESSVEEQKEELSMITCKLAALSGAVRETFIRRKTLPGDDLVKRLHDLIEEIAFTAVREDEQMTGKPLRSRKPLLIHQSTLTHLHIITATMVKLVEELQKQVEDGISFPETDIAQADNLFTQQEMILCTLEEAIRSGDERHLRAVYRACGELIRICRHSATEHEKCVEQGLCLPGAALSFLTILDLMRLLGHHELETVKLLIRWKGKSRAVPADLSHGR
jgi:Na+/phosphate symporter